MTTLTSLLPFLSTSSTRTAARGGGSAWSRLVGAMRRVVGRLGRRPSPSAAATPPIAKEPLAPPAAIRPEAIRPDAIEPPAADTPAATDEPAPTTTRLLWGTEVAVAEGPAATAAATPATTDTAPAPSPAAIEIPAIPTPDYGLTQAATRAALAAEACRGSKRLTLAPATCTPAPVRRQLGSRQLKTAAALYDNAALAMQVVEAALDRDYRGDHRWAVAIAARASSQLLHFLRHVAGEELCPVQKAVHAALNKVTEDRRIHVTEGMRWNKPIPHDSHATTRRHLELARDGKTLQDHDRAQLLNALAYDLRRLDEDAAADLPRMLRKIDATAGSLLAAPHHLSPRDPRLAIVAGLIDEVDFDPATHASIAAIADAEVPSDAERAAAAARDTRTVGQVIDECNDRWAGKLAFALNSRSDRDYPYARPREVERAFDWLATTYRDAMTDRRSVSHEDLHLSLRETAGWHFRPLQSATTVGRFREWYECSWNGRRRQVLSHIGRGDAKRMAGNSIRIGFTWDREHEVVVIGFIGQHQRTTQS